MQTEPIFQVGDSVVIQHFDPKEYPYIVGVIESFKWADPKWWYCIAVGDDPDNTFVRWEDQLLRDNNTDGMPNLLERLVDV